MKIVAFVFKKTIFDVPRDDFLNFINTLLVSFTFFTDKDRLRYVVPERPLSAFLASRARDENAGTEVLSVTEKIVVQLK